MRAMRVGWILAATLAVGPVAPAEGVLAGPVAAEVVAVVDGDTLDVRARVWLGQQVSVRVRIDGIDAPELRGRCTAERTAATAARAELSRRTLGRLVQLWEVRWDKYGGRVLARVTDAEGDVAQQALAEGWVRAYEAARGPRGASRPSPLRELLRRGRAASAIRTRHGRAPRRRRRSTSGGKWCRPAESTGR